MPETRQIAVTGAGGFVGGHLIAEIKRRGLGCVALSRETGSVNGVKVYAAGDNFTMVTPEMFSDCDAVIHCAARVHHPEDRKLSEKVVAHLYEEANVRAPLRVLEAAAKAGVRRYVFISTLHVCGRKTAPNVRLRHDSPLAPQDAYAKSKFRAETALFEAAARFDIELVIVRPPLVYGEGVKAKFAQLVRWISSGKPLPFGSLNKHVRSFISIDNLTDFLLLAATDPRATGKVFPVCDGEPVSTAALIEKIARASGVSVKNHSVWPLFLRLGLASIGKKGILETLDGTLAIDPSDTYERIGWRAPETMDEALDKFCRKKP